ncbi:MAG: metallophosphoesterase [Actinomycetota bacterium]|nr:metallophosphoesterase [Actinomycetota bacterium]
MIRIAAAGDLHFGTDSAGTLRPSLQHLPEHADVFLLAGDLTRYGDPDEATVLADELKDLGVPTFAVLGNHDYHLDQQKTVTDILEGVGVRVLEGEAEVVQVNGHRVGVVGTKGFGGGFAGACGTEFGEREMKSFMAHTREISDRLEEALESLDTDIRVVILHYSPVKGTLQGERLEIFPFLGSYLLAEPIDRVGADLIVHGHAHHGTEKGITPGGIHVRNVSLPVIKHAYNVYSIERGRLRSHAVSRT